MTASRVCADVRLALNRDERHQALIACADLDTLTVDRMIHAMMPAAVAAVESDAPASLLDSGYNFAESADLGRERAADGDLAVISVVLPPDFMRLVSFRLSDWTHPVTSPAADSSQLQAMMGLPGASAIADSRRPLGVIVRRAEGLVLVTYSSTPESAATVADAVYRPWPEWDRDDAIDVSTRLYPAAVTECASRVAASLKL